MSDPVPTASAAPPPRREPRRRAASLVLAGGLACFASIAGPPSGAGPIAGTADLAVALTDRPDPTTVGHHVFYTVTTRNRGPGAATGVRVTFSIPAGASFASAAATKGTCAPPVDATLTCRLGEVSSGTKAGVTIDVVPTEPGLMMSDASVSANEADPVARN